MCGDFKIILQLLRFTPLREIIRINVNYHVRILLWIDEESLESCEHLKIISLYIQLCHHHEYNEQKRIFIAWEFLQHEESIKNWTKSPFFYSYCTKLSILKFILLCFYKIDTWNVSHIRNLIWVCVNSIKSQFWSFWVN